MPRCLLVLSFFLAFACSASAQDRPPAMLILDGSGSMWGQIDGVNKIVIAREAIADLLRDFPDDQPLGLAAYGHRNEGDCNDVEMVIAPESGTSASIVEAVNRIKPRGKTPLSAAVMAAAEALDFTNRPATVILVSDGNETCNVDPCEVGRLLGQIGTDFTAHVIGFDVSDPAALEQLQCLADETGGTFHTAADAAELTAALQGAAGTASPPGDDPASDAVSVNLSALSGDGGPAIADGLTWRVETADGATFDVSDKAQPRLDLPPGDYTAYVRRVRDGAEAQRAVSVSDEDVTVTLILPPADRPVEIAAPETAMAGATVTVDWTGPDAAGDFIAISEPDGENGAWINYTYSGEGTPLQLLMPPQPGRYEIRYVRSEGREVLARAEIEVAPVDADLSAEGEMLAGATIRVTWSGPGYPGDRIAVLGPDDVVAAHAYTRDGSPLSLTLPPQGGDYELAYVMAQRDTVLARVPLTVEGVDASVTGPQTALAGATVSVDWTGPGYRNDMIAIVPRGEDAQVSYGYVRDGTPLKLALPSQAGAYDIAYVMDQGRRIVARSPIEIETASASLSVPADLVAGATAEIAWEGPDHPLDFIAVMPRDGTRWINVAYTGEGSPARLELPVESGEYDIAYVMNRDRTVLTRVPVTLKSLDYSLSFSETVAAGDALEVAWKGPGYRNDLIAVTYAGASEGRWLNYSYTRIGSPLQLLMPPEPGEYEIRYVSGQDRRTMARGVVQVTPVEARLSGPESAPIGSEIAVNWEGPGYRNDYIAVVPALSPDELSPIYRSTRSGQPVRLILPVEPGEYELRYVMSSGGRKVLARAPITLTDVTATLEAPDRAEAGGKLRVGWTGPGYASDYIEVAKRGDRLGSHYFHTSRGSPAMVQLPAVPGVYELRYVLGQGRKVIYSQPLVLE
ncbi:VWA domain-containing protein [Pseudoruegeria sp. HB172150]|uniref:VWA domain-containing protein n=1 Tax=Pseudoruegeria sp. HB172150 TaxID=2721164 RepID=UPI0015547B42|nr:VWA domain-containing protein [Pseudoruegeria sp. HB172150]